ncbi:uncharacterized protein LOC128867958 [Anastrepha ludens]|uniref:uncharacterized protein LOC128867958 n=1 Tax=Anastrepha ludens TaxID=28586 RepID=UPI0023AE9AC6|nr:uncharacterized protein LOC128867958 [Anastrepha ludens]
MSNCNCKNVSYFILCTLLGLAYSLPVPNENKYKSFEPTTTSTTVNPNLFGTNLRQHQQNPTPTDLNSFLILQPIVEQPNPLESVSDIHNRRTRRTLTPTQLNEPVDMEFDMELAEVNVFRPLFRYRAEVARNVGQRQQFG